MVRLDLMSKIRKHWTTYLPRKVAELNKEGRLDEAMWGAAKLAQDEIENLMKQGYPDYAAEEVALKAFVYLTPEVDSGQAQWEKDELDELERVYQKAPPSK